MKKEDIPFLNQLAEAFEEAEEKLEQAYKDKNHEMFDKSKKFILQVQKKIAEVVK